MPKSVEIQQILRQRILGDYQPGDMFSSEPKLSNEFRVSRTLIRGVLDNLAREGLIRREARRGTFVSVGVGRRRKPEISDLIERLLEYGPDTRAKVLDVTISLGEVELKRRLRLAAKEPLVVVKRQIFRDNKPLNYLVSFIPYDVGAKLTAKDIEETPIATLLMERENIPIEHAVQTVEPVVADIEVAAGLDVSVGAPTLLVERFFYDEEKLPVFCSRAFYRGDRYKFTVSLRLEKNEAKQAG